VVRKKKNPDKTGVQKNPLGTTLIRKKKGEEGEDQIQDVKNGKDCGDTKPLIVQLEIRCHKSTIHIHRESFGGRRAKREECENAVGGLDGD